jgi:membrane-associated protease RseP (regulator of RpoE activity)
MKNRRWLIAIAPALGLVCLLILGGPAMRAQVATQPKAGDKARPAERAVPTEERAAPTDVEKSGTVRRVPAAENARTGERDPAGHASRDREPRNADKAGGGWLGVYVAEADEKTAAAGVQISQIFPASPAARAGFRGGDVITQINDTKVTDPDSFISVIDAMGPGTKVAFAVQRNDQPLKLTATLGENYWISRDQDFEGRDYNGGSQARGGRNQQEEYPIQALQLEHDRRNAEQHQRMEQMLVELKEEVRQLREELKARK